MITSGLLNTFNGFACHLASHLAGHLGKRIAQVIQEVIRALKSRFENENLCSTDFQFTNWKWRQKIMRSVSFKLYGIMIFMTQPTIWYSFTYCMILPWCWPWSIICIWWQHIGIFTNYDLWFDFFTVWFCYNFWVPLPAFTNWIN